MSQQFLALRLVVALHSIGVLATCPLLAQTAVPVGGGSYASSIPAAYQFAGGFFSMTAQQVVTNYGNLHVDPALTNRPLPTSQWWTDLLLGDRSYQPAANVPRVLAQDAFGGQLWANPLVVDPESFGLNLYFPNSWTARSSANIPAGSFNPGPALQISGAVPIAVGSNDVLIANFEGTNYPAGWTTTGTAFGSGPYVGGGGACQSPTVQGFIGNACVNSFLCSDAPTGALTSATFTLQKNFIHLLAGGGNDPNLTAVRLIVSNSIVRTATGQQNGTLSWNTWDVSAYLGQSARIQIVDLSSGSWGFIMCDFLVASDDGSNPAARYTDTFAPQRSVVTGWSDWGVQFALPDPRGRRMDVTLARGVPFVWTTCSNFTPRIKLGSATTLYDTNGAAIPRTNGGSFTTTAFAFDFQGRTLGVFAPENTPFLVDGNYVVPQLAGTNNYLVYGALPAVTNLAEFAGYAYSRVTNTTYSWTYDITNGQIVTTWKLATTTLRGSQTNTLQGWLPHHYRSTSNHLPFEPHTYLTPRGLMKLAVGNQFQIAYNFAGIAPMLPAPHLNNLPNDYVASRMTNYLNSFAANYPYNVGDTYGAGKTFGLTAQYLGFARQLGMTNQAAQLATGLRNLLANWFTYTPGEADSFFARYQNWRALVGFPASYGSEAFNDNHFHYGYFLDAAALVGLEDPAFLTQYGPMAKLVAKECANWDRAETNFPFLRVFDIWEGHSSAGGFSSAGGNNQESSSEAMNAWVGLFLLGSALADVDMTAAGAMGYAVESAAVNEYWQDSSRTNLPASYGKGMVGIVWSGGLAYGTYFSGDPAWIYGIQWVPANHWNNYLCRDKSFAAWQLTNLWQERIVASQFGVNGFTLTDANNAVALGEYLGNYVLGFQTLFDADGVAAIMGAAYATNAAIATGPNYSGATYYLTHSLRALGDPDPDYHTSIPTSQVYFNGATGKRTYVIYNPAPTNQTATIYHLGAAVDSVVAPAGKLVSPSAFTTNTLVVSLQAGAQISWPTISGNQYQLQWSSAPSYGPPWSNFGTLITGTGASNVLFDPAYPALHSHFQVIESVTSVGNSILVNPGFEAGSGGSATGWNLTGSQPPTRVSGNARSGSYSLQLYVTNSATTPNSSEFNQNIVTAGGAAIGPGVGYTLSFWAKRVAAGPSYVQNYGLHWLDAGGISLGFVGWTAFASGNGVWLQTTVTNLVAPAGAVNALLQIYGVTGAVAGGYGGSFIDDLALFPRAGGTVTNTFSPTVVAGVQIRWPTEPDSNYQIQSAGVLSASPPWTNVATFTGSGGWQEWFDSMAPNRQKFFRVSVSR